MMDERKLSELRALFPRYSSAMCEADWLFYRSFDPVHFVRLAAQFRLPPYLSEPDGVGKDLIPDNADMFEQTRQSFFRFVRYLSSETLTLFLLSGYPFGPAPCQMEKLRGKKLNRVFVELSAGTVPESFRLFRGKTALEFSEWFNVLAFGGFSSDSDYCKRVAEFVSGECAMIANREGINAYKHGRVQKSVKGQAFQLRLNEEDRAQPLLKSMKGAIHWLGWNEKSENSELVHTIKFGFEEVDDEVDYDIIVASGALMSAIAKIRRKRMEGATSFDVFLPDMDVGRQFNQRMTFESATTWSLNGGGE